MTQTTERHTTPPSPISKQERETLIHAWNQTRTDYPRERTLHDLLDAQASLTPHRLAVTFDGRSLTYAELEQRSNQLAHYLRQLGVGPETLVGLYVDRSLEMVVGLIGILKAGGAYIPLDPDFPAERITLMLDDAAPPVLVTQQALLAHVAHAAPTAVCLDNDWPAIARHPSHAPATAVTPNNLAYVIYTSGSTGKPKGVQISHSAAVNFLTAMANEPGLAPDDHLLAVTTLSFDIALLEICLPLITGARVTIAPRELAMDGVRLAEALDASAITVMQATPATWWLLLAARWPGKSDLKLLCGGEALPLDLARQLLPRCAELWNMYGPTETTVWSTTCQITAETHPITIGRPIANTQIYILDEAMQPVPIGDIGDLYIGGDGVARGYLNRPQLTGERFVPNPFSADDPAASAIIYKTGDKARYLADGRLLFHGRDDHQVKIRGYRIELGDVETAVGKHPAVAQNVTIAREDSPGNRQLVTYLIPQAGETPPTPHELRAFLSQSLPDYMLPARFVTLDAFPLTPNNKLNRMALPAPNRAIADHERDHGRGQTPPRTPLETELAGFAADILNLNRVGIHDSFFDLGGNSLLAMRLIARLRDVYSVALPLRTIFQTPTVAGLAAAVTQLQPTQPQPAPPTNVATAVAEPPAPDTGENAALLAQSNLTRGQFLMWTGQRFHPDIPLYNVIHAFTINGPLDVGAFRTAFQAMLAQTDALRTIIIEQGGVPQQQVLPEVVAEIDLVDLTTAPDPDAAYRAWVAQRKSRPLPFNQPLFDTAVLQLAPDRFVWYLCQHHIITDALSEDLVFSRVAANYERALKHELDDLPQPPQYADYVRAERALRETERFRAADAYWRARAAAALPPTEFYGRTGRDKSVQTSRLVHRLGRERSARLREIALTGPFASSSPDLSLFTVFATLLFTTLHRINGRSTLRIGTPFHGRPTAESLDIAGLFIEMGLLDVELDPDDTFADLADRVMAEALAGLAHVQPGMSSAATNRAYDVILNFLQPSFTDFAGLPVSNEWIHSGCIDQDHALRLQVTDFDGSGNLALVFDTKTAVFDDTRRNWLKTHFLRVVDAFIADPTRPIGSFDLLSAAERQHLLVDFNATDAPYPADQTVVQLFEAQVARTPDAIAAVRGDKSLTYAALNGRANQLAHYLKALGVGPETAVALCMERSIDALVVIWGVLKAGGAYVPIDPAYPPERIAMMLADAEPVVVFGDAALVNGRGPTVQLNSLNLNAYPTSNPSPAAGPSNLVYMIYTSGSTGTPKGTMLTHQGLVNYVWWARQAYQNGAALDFPLYSSLAFDLTVTSLFVPLISGGKVVVYAESDHTRGLEILSVFRDDAVDIVKLTPAHLALVQETAVIPHRIRTLIVGGEDFKTDLARSVHDAFGGQVAIYNEYGPTEAVVGCMIHRYDVAQDTAVSVPIGTPAANARIYLLDAHDQPVPPGVVGEMVISSDGVARGYRNRPELTAERFGHDPFRPDARIYRTGDIARWDAHGRMVFLGRRDHQVKIRGARIELGEIEAALLAHPQVETAVVDVIHVQRDWQTIQHCIRCGLPSNYPDSDFDADGLCADCRAYDHYQDEVARYFRTPAELRTMLGQTKAARADKPYDCMVLVSGGKDSTYMLYQLVREFGMRPLVFSLDNGYISQEALDNIRNISADLGVGLKIATTPHMNAIFADSLRRHSNVCDGCFKAIYTLSMNLARELGIDTIVTGLARGQLFETRLADTFRARCFDPATIDDWIMDARKAYHQIEDATTQLLDVRIFNNDSIFDEMQFIDFYRYTDVDLDEVYAYLDTQTVWKRPSDTGRSTNCLINDAGIYIHKKERGYHNYALPYSWDVRLGHKNREMAMYELDDDLDLDDVRRMLDEIGYDENEKLAQRTDKRLAAYIVASAPLSTSDLRAYLAQRLPDYMLPSSFTQLDELPLTTNGKIDRAALPDPDHGRPDLDTRFAPPTNAREQRLSDIWTEVFRLPEIGIHDNFFDLGGDSIISIQIVSRAREFGLALAPRDIFAHQTIAELAAVLPAETPQPAGTTPPHAAEPTGSEFDLVDLDDDQMDHLADLLRNLDG